eukprot:Anaeramoba_ignava/a480793_53.p1 GENE.a480793_53~~a480793_53.p1  ORF type:complete len:917 (+),score=259.65 a480793_53:298-3048(+)
MKIVENMGFYGDFSSSSNSSITVEVYSEYQIPLFFTGGNIYLSGLLDVSFMIAEFEPELEQAFTIIDFGSITGKDISTLEYYDSTEKFEVNIKTNQIQYVFMGCQTGSYSSDLYSECRDCDYGRYSSSRGSFSCDLCDLGHYTNQTGSSNCSLCSPGAFSSGRGTINCTLCSPGTFTSDNGSYSCSECSQGYYSDYEGATECQKCGRGHQTTSPSSCDPCKSGTYNNKEASRCVLCSSGTYSGVGAISCTPCEKNYYQDQLGQPSCKNCPSNTITFSQASTSIQECVCKEGMYGEPGGNCKECPEGGICDEAGITEPEVKAGYWADDNLNFYHCDPFEACPGGAKGTCNSNLGYEGVMCSECSNGFYRISGRCEKCPANAKTRLIIAFFLIMIFAIILLIIVRSQARSYFGSLSIAFSFFQILATLPKMNINWPPRLKNFMNSLTSFNFNVDLVAPECSISASFTGKWFAVMLIPFLVLAMFAFLFLIVRLHAVIIRKCGSKFANKFPKFCSRPTRKTTNKYLLPFSWIRFQISKLFTHGNSSAKKLYSTFVNGYVAFAFLIYLVLCQWVFDLFSCTKQADGIYTLNAAPSYRCYNDPWWKKMAVGGVLFGLLYVIGIPAFIIFMLFYHSKKYNDEMFYSRLSLLCSRFRREWFFWELIVMARKALFVFALLYFNFASDLQIRLLILVLLIAIILQVAFEPYDTQGRNRAEMILLCVLEIVMISSFVFVSDESGDTKAKERIETFVLILIWMAIIVIFFVLINEIVERVKYKKEKRKIKKRNRERDLLEVLKESEFIVFLDEKPSFDLIVQWIGTLSKKESSKFANFISQFDDLIQKNSIQFPEQNYLDNWRELIQNDLKNWYEQRATIKEKLMFSSLINSLFMYLVEKGDNPIQRWRSNTQNIIPLSQNENEIIF